MQQGTPKLHVFARVSDYTDLIKLKLLINAFIKSQFNYCPPVWMFHDRRDNVKLNKIFERAMRIAYNNSGNNSVNKSLTIHQRNLQLLMTKLFKIKNKLNPIFMKDIFSKKIAIIVCKMQIICNCRK